MQQKTAGTRSGMLAFIGIGFIVAAVIALGAGIVVTIAGIAR
jgi:hypothetical protein